MTPANDDDDGSYRNLDATSGADLAMPYLAAKVAEGSLYVKTRDIAEWLDRPVSSVSHAMMELERRGIVSRWGEGRAITWYIDADEVNDEY